MPGKSFKPSIMFMRKALPFYGRKLRLLILAMMFVPGKPFELSLMFSGKARRIS
jgi:hypothetical protein